MQTDLHCNGRPAGQVRGARPLSYLGWLGLHSTALLIG